MAADVVVKQVKNNQSSRTLGLVLVALGVAFLLSQIIPGFGQVIWAAAFLAGGGFLYTVYQKDTKKWGWLLGGYTLALIGVTNVLDIFGFEQLIAVALLGGFAVPFLYAYTKTEQWGWLIPAGMFLIPASIVLLGVVWSWLPVMLIIGGVYLLIRANTSDEDTQPATPKYFDAIQKDAPQPATVTKHPVAEMRSIDIETPQV